MTDNKYKPLAFWFWNDRLNKKELKTQIIEMKKKGIGGFFFQARFGFEVKFLSPEWFDYVDYSVEIAKSNNMDIWIYDEVNWPSGTAGGVVTENKKFRQKIMRVGYEYELKGINTVKIDANYSKEMIAIYAVDFDKNEIVNLNKHMIAGKINYDLPYKANWKIIGIEKEDVWANEKYYLDYLNPDAVRSFIDIAYESYRKYFKDIEGFFTDEPGLNYYLIFYGLDRKTYFWSDIIPEAFLKRFGYELIDKIPAFFYKMGDLTRKVRLDFCSLVMDMFAKSYYEQIHTYCRENSLKFIGHAEDTDNIWRAARENLDIFKANYHFDYGGCDALFTQTWPGSTSLNTFISRRFATSISHLMGKERSMCEAFAMCDPWFLNLRKLKWLTDFMFVMGIDLIVIHGYYYSLRGFRKFESTPAHSHQVNFWKYYHILTEYMEQMCKILTGAKNQCDVAIYYPIKSLWENMEFDVDIVNKYPPRSQEYPDDMWGKIPSKDVMEGKVVSFFEDLSIELFKNNIDYDYINEDFLLNSKIHDGEIEIPGVNNIQAKYKYIIFPYCTFLSPKIIEKIERMEKENIEIIFGGLNSYDDGKYHSINEIVDKLYSKNILELNQKDQTGNPPLEGKGVIHRYFKKEEVDYFYFCNSSLNDILNCKIKIKLNRKILAKYDFEKQCYLSDISYSIKNDEIIFSYDFYPTEALVIALVDDTRTIKIKETDTKNNLSLKNPSQKIKIAGPYQFNILNDNNLSIANWDQEERGCRKIFGKNIMIRKKPSRLSFLIDDLPEIYSTKEAVLKVNGEKIDEFKQSSYFDRNMVQAEITKNIKEGINNITIENLDRNINKDFDGMIKILGDFSLDRDNNIIKLRNEAIKGSLTDQGFPYFSGSMEYIKEVDLQDLFLHKSVYIKIYSIEDAIELFINNKFVKIMIWDPYISEISRFLRRGKNIFKFIITNSPHNFIYNNTQRKFGLEKEPEIILF